MDAKRGSVAQIWQIRGLHSIQLIWSVALSSKLILYHSSCPVEWNDGDDGSSLSGISPPYLTIGSSLIWWFRIKWSASSFYYENIIPCNGYLLCTAKKFLVHNTWAIASSITTSSASVELFVFSLCLLDAAYVVPFPRVIIIQLWLVMSGYTTIHPTVWMLFGSILRVRSQVPFRYWSHQAFVSLFCKACRPFYFSSALKCNSSSSNIFHGHVRSLNSLIS